MSYLVLARKWRPQNFQEVIGQPHVAKTLENAIKSSRIAHAYLFTGARGVGKTSVARILAKAINCQKGITAHPCGECSNCREIAGGSAVDVIEIDGASNRGIDSIRELRETVRYRPAKSAYKVYIIDEVHMLTNEAFNALLKTLEEPPEHVLFIFATTEPHKVPSTILSRCQRFDFRRIPNKLILEHLKRIAREEEADLSETVVFSIAREADGSMRDAQSLLEQVLVFSGDDLSDTEMLDILGVVDRRSVTRVGDAIVQKDVQTCLEVVRDLYERGIDSKRFCQQLCDHFRNLLFVSLGKETDVSWLGLPEEEWKALSEAARKTSASSLYLYFQTILKGEEEIRRSPMPRIALEMLLLRLTQLPRLESMEELVDKLSVLESQLERGELPAVGTEPVPTRGRREAAAEENRPLGKEHDNPPAPKAQAVSEEAPSLGPPENEASEPGPPPPEGESLGSPEELRERWPDLLSWLEARDRTIAIKLKGAEVEDVSGSIVTLGVNEVYENSLKAPEVLGKLKELARSYCGLSLEWAVRKRDPSKGESKGAQKPKRSRGNLNRMVMEDRMVQEALETLNGELVEVRPVKKKPVKKKP